MDIVAIVSEYNPFHKGHKYQIDEIKKIIPDSSIISVMSPNFVQRGYPAVYDKYTRGECAVRSGADLAVSMPQVFAVLSAEGFAEGGVRIASKLGATHLAFGVENQDEALITAIASFLITSEFEEAIKKELDLSPSLSYPAVREKILEKELGKEAASFIKTPNNILAVEYVKAILRYASHLKILPIKRIGNAHADSSRHGDILSATAIRGLIAENSDFLYALPEETAKTVSDANRFDFKKFEALLYSVIFSKKKTDILKCSGNAELTDIIFKNAQSYPDFPSFRGSLARRRHTQTKIDRVLINTLLDIGFDEHLHNEPEYATILAINNKGKKIISSIRKSTDLMLISRGVDGKKQVPNGIDVEIFADRIYGRCMTAPVDGGYFLRKKPFVYEE